MGIAERFAGRADGSEWRGQLLRQTDYYTVVLSRMLEFPFNHRALCSRNLFCILTYRHAGPCLAFINLQNIPADPALPPERQAPGTTL
jgi:hypothetical protein